MDHSATITFPRARFEKANQLLSINSFSELDADMMDVLSAKEDDSQPLYTVNFDNGATMSLWLYSGQSNYYTEPVLIVADGSEPNHFDNVGFSLSETEEFNFGDDTYIVHLALIDDPTLESLSVDM